MGKDTTKGEAGDEVRWSARPEWRKTERKEPENTNRMNHNTSTSFGEQQDDRGKRTRCKTDGRCHNANTFP